MGIFYGESNIRKQNYNVGSFIFWENKEKMQKKVGCVMYFGLHIALTKEDKHIARSKCVYIYIFPYVLWLINGINY